MTQPDRTRLTRIVYQWGLYEVEGLPAVQPGGRVGPQGYPSSVGPHPEFEARSIETDVYRLWCHGRVEDALRACNPHQEVRDEMRELAWLLGYLSQAPKMVAPICPAIVTGLWDVFLQAVDAQCKKVPPPREVAA